MSTAESARPVLSAAGITKGFFGVEVLHGVSLDVRSGTVHGLVGENGAGKSTLMKIIAGVHQRDSGELRINGELVDFTHPVEAERAGVATVFQEFNLLPDRTVAQNVFLGREPHKWGIVDAAAMKRRTQELLDELDVTGITPEAKVGWLTVAEQQIVEIIKALSVDAKVISMDEPTAALSDNEVTVLYRVIDTLKAKGVAIIYVSHRLQEIFDLCDEITVLKDGSLAACRPRVEFDHASLVRAMVGRPISAFFPEPEPGTTIGEPLLEVNDGGNEQLDSIELELRAGEILGAPASGLRADRTARSPLRNSAVHTRCGSPVRAVGEHRHRSAGRATRTGSGDGRSQRHWSGTVAIHFGQCAAGCPSRVPVENCPGEDGDPVDSRIARNHQPGTRSGSASAVRRESAEGRPCEMAGDLAPDRAARRTYPRDRRRSKGRGLPTGPEPGAPRRGDHLRFE